MSDRLTKQQLKDDALMAQTAKTADFVTHHVKLIAGVAIVVILGAAVFLFTRANTARSEDRAAALLVQARMEYERGDLVAATGRLDELVRNLAGTGSGRRATLLYGDVMYDQGRYQEAEGYYRRALDSLGGDPIASMSARWGLAACLESTERHQQAAAEYGTLAAKAPNEVLRMELQLAQARNLLRAGMRNDAVALYRSLGDNPANPRVAQQAKLILAEVEALREG